MILTALSYIGRISRTLSRRWASIAGRAQLRALGIDVPKDLVLYGIPIVTVVDGSQIVIGQRVVLCSDSRYTALGVNHQVVLRTLTAGASIRIGNDTGISGASICAANSVSIGDGCLLGANVTIADTDFHPIQSGQRRYALDAAVAPIAIEDNVFIGTNSIVLKGVSIGRNSVIGAGSVVSRSIPADVIAAGNPCRVISALAAADSPPSSRPVSEARGL